MFERLFLRAFTVMARIRTVFAGKGYEAERYRKLCRVFKVTPRIHKRGFPHGSGLEASLAGQTHQRMAAGEQET